ncbi:phytanoyl-CoA dioxygenase family protein [Thalassospiraceae bacterium LMO-SO8]|nr:phytanoyl-CoA dioxygenase family protein [Alphaproteobacteria bacterium LMO-S08]WND76634.1 phytanoyl-CoA dioxygenase family protein [Thalassospiraceae bacterium LMO-SO8]
MKALREDQVAGFHRDGYLFPVPMLSADETAAALDDLARYEAWLGAPLPETERKWRTMPFAHLPWFNKLVRDPRVLDVVEDLIGPDILVWTSTFWIKEPRSPHVAAWHQDNAYFGLDPSVEVCAWLALTDADSKAGCMNVIPWRGEAPRVLHHAPAQVDVSINRGTQSVVEPFDETAKVAMELKAGSFSVHHGLCMHASAPNGADYRRIGLGFNYIPAHVRTAGSVRMAAMLVRGEDRWGNFDLIDPPGGECSPEALALHDEIVGRYGANYSEQIEWHRRDFAAAG